MLDFLIQEIKNHDQAFKELPKILKLIGSKTLELVLQVLQHEDTAIQKAAVEALWMIYEERCKKSECIQEETREILIHLRSSGVVDIFIELLKSSNLVSRINAVKALGEIGNERVVEPLIQAIFDDDEILRANVLKAIIKMRNKRGILLLSDAIDREPEFLMRDMLNEIKEIFNFTCSNCGGKIHEEKLVLEACKLQYQILLVQIVEEHPFSIDVKLFCCECYDDELSKYGIESN